MLPIKVHKKNDFTLRTPALEESDAVLSLWSDVCYL